MMIEMVLDKKDIVIKPKYFLNIKIDPLFESDEFLKKIEQEISGAS